MELKGSLERLLNPTSLQNRLPVTWVAQWASVKHLGQARRCSVPLRVEGRQSLPLKELPSHSKLLSKLSKTTSQLVLLSLKDLILKETKINKETEEELNDSLPQLHMAEEEYMEKHRKLQELCAILAGASAALGGCPPPRSSQQEGGGTPDSSGEARPPVSSL